MNILVYRTVRPETMDQVIKSIFSEYGTSNEITVISRGENRLTMLSIEGVSNFIEFNGISFSRRFLSSKIRKDLKQLNYFDLAIIPISGNPVSYSNVIKFHKNLFNTKKIVYFRYPDTFAVYRFNIFKHVANYFISIFAIILTIISLPVFIFMVLIDSVKGDSVEKI